MRSKREDHDGSSNTTMIRFARPDDVDAIASVHVEAWRSTYRGYVPAALLDGLSVERRAEMWRKIVSLNPGNVAVVDVAAEIVGFVSVGTSRDDDAEPGTGEITAIHILPARWRRGFGTLLMGWARATARHRRWRKMTLWVFKENSQARAFYEALDWSPDGEERSDVFEGEVLEELRYVQVDGAGLKAAQRHDAAGQGKPHGG